MDAALIELVCQRAGGYCEYGTIEGRTSDASGL